MWVQEMVFFFVLLLVFTGIFLVFIFFEQWEMGKVAIAFVWLICISEFNLRGQSKISTVVYVVVLQATGSNCTVQYYQLLQR
jgi:hypothetical protein